MHGELTIKTLIVNHGFFHENKSSKDLYPFLIGWMESAVIEVNRKLSMILEVLTHLTLVFHKSFSELIGIAENWIATFSTVDTRLAFFNRS